MSRARESFGAAALDWAQAGVAAIMTKTVRTKRFTEALLNNIGIHFVMVSPATLGCVIQKFRRILPGARKALENAAFQHVLGAFAFPNLFEKACPNFFHHVALGLEFGFGHDEPVG